MEDLDELLADLQFTTDRLMVEKPDVNGRTSPNVQLRGAPPLLPKATIALPGMNTNLHQLNSVLESDVKPNFSNEGRLSNNDYISMYAANDERNDGRLSPYEHDYIQVSSPVRAAHTASRDLDALMNTLSEFKLQEQKQKQPTSQVSMSSPPVKHDYQQQNSDDLDSMLGNLSETMAIRGVDTSAKGNCAACNKPILDKVITAMGRPWHFEHFVCAECSSELGTLNFYEREGAPFCETCYQISFAPKCADCGEAILNRCVTALDRAWHPEHFRCTKCHCAFDEKQGFHDRDGQPFCTKCFYDSFGPRCFGCRNPIISNYLSALGATWHPNCFVCLECGRDFSSGSFYEHEGRPFCELHYHAAKGSLCATCQEPITGRCMTAMGRKYHPEHFRCSFCTKELNSGTFKEKDEKAYCHMCFGKLFG